MLAVQGILAALRSRDTGGLGQHVDVGLYQATVICRPIALLTPEFYQEEFPVLPAVKDHRGVRPLFNLNDCADGRWLSIGAWTPALAYKALEVMGLTHLLGDERFAGMPNLFPDPEAKFGEQPIDHWLEALDAQGIPCEPVLTIPEFREVSQLWENGLAIQVDDPVVGPMVQQGLVGELAGTPGEIRWAEPSARPTSAAEEVAARWRGLAPIRGSGRVPPADVGRWPASACWT